MTKGMWLILMISAGIFLGTLVDNVPYCLIFGLIVGIILENKEKQLKKCYEK